MSSHIDMLHGPTLGKLLLFALPLIASGVLQQSFNSADIAVAGRWAGSEALAAVGSNGPVISLIVNLFVGISVGANVVIARLIGQGDKERVRRAVSTSAAVALAGGLLLLVTGVAVARPILEWLDTPPEVLGLAVEYLRIYSLGFPFMMIYNFGAAILRSFGDTRRPFYILVASGIVNVALNLLLVIGFGMGVAGVAVATVVSNAVSAGIITVLLMREPEPGRLDLRSMRPDRRALARILQIGVPAGVQGMVFSISNVFILGAINSLGAKVLAGSAAALNYECYSYFVISAIAQTAVAFVSQNYGAGYYDRCRRIFMQCMMLSLAGSAILNIGFCLDKPFFAGIFTADPEVLVYAGQRMQYVLLVQFIASSYEIAGAAMRGLGYSMTPTVLTIFGTCVLRIVWLHTVCADNITFRRVMLVYPVSWAITGVAVLAAYFIVARRAFARGGVTEPVMPEAHCAERRATP